MVISEMKAMSDEVSIAKAKAGFAALVARAVLVGDTRSPHSPDQRTAARHD